MKKIGIVFLLLHCLIIQVYAHYGISPYVYCSGNPVNMRDVDGKDTRDIFAGIGMGIISNIVPGIGSLRDSYSPTDANDYNGALKAVDNTMVSLGGSLDAGGKSAFIAGGTLAIVGMQVEAATLGAGTIPVVADEAVAGVLVVVGTSASTMGTLIKMNASSNQKDGYERGEKSNSSRYTPKDAVKDGLKGRLPEGISGVHNPKIGQIHAHDKSGRGLNVDGSFHDKKGGTPEFPKKAIEYLKERGFNTETLKK